MLGVHQPPVFDPGMERGPLLDHQAKHRDVLRCQLNRFLKILLPPGEGLARNREHQVQRNIDAGILQETSCPSNPLFPMIPLQLFQRGILERLDSQDHACHAPRGKP